MMPSMAQVKVGVFLPFKSGGAIGESAVEYYRGLLMAVDSLSQGGQQFTVTAAHSGQTAQDMQALLNESQNGVFDIIFAPSNQEQLRIVNEYSRRNGTKVAVPFGGAYDDFISNPSFYALRVTQTDFTPSAYQLMISALKDKVPYVVSCNGDAQICPFANYVSKYVKGAKQLEWPKQEKKIVQLMADESAVLIPSMYDALRQERRCEGCHRGLPCVVRPCADRGRPQGPVSDERLCHPTVFSAFRPAESKEVCCHV